MEESGGKSRKVEESGVKSLRKSFAENYMCNEFGMKKYLVLIPM